MTDTIYALSTPVGGAIAVIRISGPDTLCALRAVFSGKIEHRYVAHGSITGADGSPIDDAMAVYFQGPKSYTGEDMAELYIHGGYAVSRRVLSRLSELPLRPAGPGEFTRRAFINGKLDLARSEAVMDLINASSSRGAASALEQLQGSLSRRIEKVEEEILDLLSGIDAAIDYPEELEEDVFSALPEGIRAARAEIDSLISGGMASRMVREGARIAILGRPNAGKSSLFNAMLGEDRAIVTPEAGTTRDILEGTLLINGITARLFDTAGLREADSAAESIGISRARDIVDRADLLLIAMDGGDAVSHEERRLLASPGRKLAVIWQERPFRRRGGLRSCKGVRRGGHRRERGHGRGGRRAHRPHRRAYRPGSAKAPSSQTAAISQPLGNAPRRSPPPSKQRRRTASPPTFARRSSPWARITGKSVDADVVDRIFSRFCVGK